MSETKRLAAFIETHRACNDLIIAETDVIPDVVRLDCEGCNANIQVSIAPTETVEHGEDDDIVERLEAIADAMPSTMHEDQRAIEVAAARLRRSAPREVVGYFSEVDWGDGRGWIRAPQQYDKRSHAVQSILDAMGYDDCPPNARGRIIPLHDGTPEPVGPPIGDEDS